MSTTFEVYPGTGEMPTFEKLLMAANSHLASRLRMSGIAGDVEIGISLRRCNGDAKIPHKLGSPLKWNDDTYAWFAVRGVAGGTDAYFEAVDDLTREVLEDHLRDNHLTHHRETVHRCLSLGHYWTFRRSAGQPGIVNLVYGLLAGSLAELTSGLVFSYDSAWVWPLFPATGRDFLSRYLVPGGTSDPEAEEWTTKCLSWIPGELAGRDTSE